MAPAGVGEKRRGKRKMKNSKGGDRNRGRRRCGGVMQVDPKKHKSG